MTIFIGWKLMVSLIFLIHVQGQGQDTSRAQGDDSSDAAFETTRNLYTAIRNVAFPEHKLSDETGVENRFILLMPGKVLNYFDYFPGKDYTDFILNPDASNHEAVVPPHVMEKWFDLADVMPSSNVMNGQDTGKSLANVYSSILHEMKYTGFDIDSDAQNAYYNQAVTFLNELVIDPDKPDSQLPRLSLYERYRDMYNERKLHMEDQIEEKRLNVRYKDYELWFQRHYPSLQSQVESAYTRWLIFGEKERVESYITLLDTGSSGQLIEEARMSLRASGVSSLDRTRTVYPVYFEPSDWYKYLLPEDQQLSRDQLQLMLGKILSKRDALDELIDIVANSSHDTKLSETIAKLRNANQEIQRASNQNISDYMKSRYICIGAATGECDDYESNKKSVIEGLTEKTQAFVAYQYAKDQTSSEYLTSLQRERSRLETQSRQITSLLGESSAFLGGILEASSLKVANLSDRYRDDQWMQFQFDSSNYFQQTDDKETSKSVTAHMHFRVLFFSGGGDYSYNKQTSDHHEKIAQSHMKVKGELLRVDIKRPWFKPEVFETPQFTYKESSADGTTSTYVSPGRQLRETAFYDALNQDNVHYKLPEYTTSFLLARKIELEFGGLDSDTVTSTMSEMSHTSGGGGFLFFHASASVTKSQQTSHVQIKRSANGMKIEIPGAQVIGYYTEKLPRFPVKQDN